VPETNKCTNGAFGQSTAEKGKNAPDVPVYLQRKAE